MPDATPTLTIFGHLAAAIREVAAELAAERAASWASTVAKAHAPVVLDLAAHRYDDEADEQAPAERLAEAKAQLARIKAMCGIADEVSA